MQCEAVRPMTNQLCRCLDATEKPEEIGAHQANYWYPVHVATREPKRRG